MAIMNWHNGSLISAILLTLILMNVFRKQMCLWFTADWVDCTRVYNQRVHLAISCETSPHRKQYFFTLEFHGKFEIINAVNGVGANLHIIIGIVFPTT